MNDYEISKLKKELQRKQQLLKEQQQNCRVIEQELVLTSAERDKYHTELLIARKQIENIDKIIAENVKGMRAKLDEENANALNELKNLKSKLISEQLLNEKHEEEIRNKDAMISELSARLRQTSKKYKDPSLIVNTKQISEQVTLTHNQFYKLTEKYDKLCKDMENIMAQNKILRKLHGVPDNFGFDLEQIKIAQKQQLEDYKAQCRKLQTEIEQLQAERTQLRYRLRQYNTLYSNKGERYKDMTQQQLELLDLYAINLKEGKYELPQIDKSQKQMERQILKLRAQVQVLQNKYPNMMPAGGNNNNNNANNQISGDQMKKFEEQIKAYLQPLTQDIRKISEANLNGLIQNLQNLQHGQVQNGDIPSQNFKGPIPLPVAHNDWSKIKEGYSFMYSSKIPVDMKELQNDVSFDIMKAKYEVAALQLQNIESLKLLKQKQKIETHLAKQLFQLKNKYKKCLKVQDQLFIRYFKDKQTVNDRLKKLQIQKNQLQNQNDQLTAKLDIITNAYNDVSGKGGNTQKRLNQYTSRLAISQAQVLKLQRKYQIVQDQEKSLRETYTKLEQKTNKVEFNLKEKLIHAKNNERQLTVLVNKVLDQVKGSVSADVHDTLLQKMQLMNDKNSHMISKESELRMRIQKLEGLERDSNTKDQIIQNLRQDNLEVLLELQIIRNRLRTIDDNYRSFCQTFERFIAFINQNNISLMSYFKKFDRDNSGQLDKQEFKKSLDALGFKLNEHELNLLFGQFDIDGSGSVTYKEFMRKMRRGGAISRTKQQQGVLKLFKAIQHCKLSIKQAFKIIDRDGSNQISKSEMQSALASIGINTTSQTVNYLFKMCDYNGDNSISCSELERLHREMISQSDVIDKEIYCEDIDWKLAFVLKLQEVCLKYNRSLNETFKKLDDDGNEVLTIAELSDFVKNSKMAIQTSALRELFDFLDRRRDGKVQFGEFLKVLAQAKSEQKRIERLKYIRVRTNQLKSESQALINSKAYIQSQSIIHRDSEVQKLKIRVESLQTKHKNLLKRNEKIASDLAHKQQQAKDLNKSVQEYQKQSQINLQKFHDQKIAKITLQSYSQKGLSAKQAAALKYKLNELQIKNVQMINDVDLYKGLYQGLTDKNRGQQLRIGKIQAQRNKYYDIVKSLQSTSDMKAEVGKLHIQIEHSKRNEEIINSKYDKIVEDLRKIDDQNKKLADLSTEKEKQIINAYLFFHQKGKLQQMKIDDLSLKIIPTVSIEKMQQFIIKLRQISNSKSTLEQQNRMIREKNFNLQARNDYVENERVHLEQLERKLRNTHSDDNSKAIIDLTKKLSDYKMNQLKAKRELNLLKEKQEYYLRVNNAHMDNIKEIQVELSEWEVKFNEREEFWRKRLADQMKLTEQFQQQFNKAKQEQLKAVSYFSQKNIEQESVNKKYKNLNGENYNNISQFVKNPNQDNDSYTEQLLEKVAKLSEELMEREKQLHQLKSAWKQIVPQANNHRLSDFGSQMNVSTNSFVLQTQLTGSQLKNNARRFLNGQKQVEAYYKQQNARITQVARQSIETLQKMIDDKNQQIRKKQRIIQDLKKHFNESSQRDCVQIQKLNEQIRQLRSKTQMGSINQLMSRTTNKNFYPGSKSQSKVQELQQVIFSKEDEIKKLQQDYNKLFISKTTSQNQKTAAKNASNGDKLKQKLDELTYERENEKKKFMEKEKELQQQVSNLKKLLNTKTKKIEQLNNTLKDIKDDIVNEKIKLSDHETEQNMKVFIENMTKGSNKNDAVVEQYMQQALVKIKNLQTQNKDLQGQLSRAKDAMGKTANKFGK